METMGYRNFNAVVECAKNRRLARPRGDNMSFDPMAFTLLAYMAENSRDWPPTGEQRASHTPCRVYSLGWGAVVKDLGMDALSSEQMIGMSAEDVRELQKARWDASIVRVGKASKFLQQQGLIKLLRKADIRRELNAEWVLMIGSETENKQVEAWALECLPYKRRHKSVNNSLDYSLGL